MLYKWIRLLYSIHSAKAMAPHSSTLAWKIPWMEEPGRLQSMGSLRVGYDWVTSLSLFTFMHWRRKWQPTPVFLPGESQGRGAWWAAVYGVAQCQTRLKWLSIAFINEEINSDHSIMIIPMIKQNEWHILKWERVSPESTDFFFFKNIYLTYRKYWLSGLFTNIDSFNLHNNSVI